LAHACPSAGSDLQIGAIRDAGHPLAHDPGRGQGPKRPLAQGFQIWHVARHQVVRQGIRTQGTGSPLPLHPVHDCATHLLQQGLQAKRPHDLVEPAHILLEHRVIQQHKRTQRLALRGGGDAAFHGRMRQARLDLSPAHLARRPGAVKQDETSHPAHRGLFGPQARVAGTHPPAHLSEERGRLMRRGRTVVLDHSSLLFGHVRGSMPTM